MSPGWDRFSYLELHVLINGQLLSVHIILQGCDYVHLAPPTASVYVCFHVWVCACVCVCVYARVHAVCAFISMYSCHVVSCAMLFI